MKKSLLFLAGLMGLFSAFSQSDVSGPGIGHQRLAGRYVGWSPAAPGSVSGDLQIRNDFNQPINFFTNNTQKAQFTVSTGIPAGLFGAAGDGLRIYPNTPGSFPNGYLDLWTSTSAAAANETHIKWDGSGQIGGSGAWFRMWSSAGNGLEFNTTIATSRYIYRRLGNEVGRIGVNNYWKIGQALFGDANRRLEVAENIANNPQFRISHSAGATYSWVDFQSFSEYIAVYFMKTHMPNIISTIDPTLTGKDGEI